MRFFFFSEQTYDIHGKRLLSPYLQRKASLQEHHQSRPFERNDRYFPAYQGAPIQTQVSSDRDTHRRFNTPTHKASAKPAGSTSPIGVFI